MASTTAASTAAASSAFSRAALASSSSRARRTATYTMSSTPAVAPSATMGRACPKRRIVLMCVQRKAARGRHLRLLQRGGATRPPCHVRMLYEPFTQGGGSLSVVARAARRLR
eukprot:4625864-Prymnesium_polylepis.1